MRFLLPVIALGWSAIAFAQQSDRELLDYVVGLRVEHQSNISLLPGDDIEDLVISPFLDFNINRRGSQWQLEASGNLLYATYLEDNFDSEYRGILNARFEYQILPDRLSWIVEDNLARAAINTFSVQNPNNQQQTNTFSTGPDLSIRLNSRDSLVLGARIQDFYSDRDDTDSTSESVSAVLTRQSSASRSYFLNLSATSLDFDEASFGIDGFDQLDAAIGFLQAFTIGGATHSVSLSGGYSESDFNGQNGSIQSPVVQFDWQRTRNDGSSLGISVVQDIGNFAGSVSEINRFSPDNLSLLQQSTTDPFERRQAGVNLTQRLGPRTGLNVNVLVEDREFSQGILDEQSYSFNGGLDFQLTPLTSFTFNVNSRRREFDSGQDDTFHNVDFGVRMVRTRRWSYDLTFGYQKRSSSVADFDADNKSVALSINYVR